MRLDFTGALFPGPGNYNFSGVTFSGPPVIFAAARFHGARVSFGGSSIKTRLSFEGCTGNSGEVVFSYAKIASGARIDFSRTAFSGGFQLRLDSIEMTGGVVTLDPGISEHAAVVLHESRVSGGRIDCTTTTCVGNGKLIFSNTEVTGEGVIELPDRTLSANTFSGHYTDPERASIVS